MGPGRWGTAFVVMAAFALPASAQATTYHVDATPTGTMDCSTPANACALATGALMATTNGDEILLSNDTYTLPSTIQFNNAIRVAPRTAGTYPTINGVAPNKIIVTGTATLEDLTISVTGLSAGVAALSLGNGTGRRLVVSATGMSAVGVDIDGGTLTDSGVRKSDQFGAAIRTGPGGDNVSRIVNVTSAHIHPGPGSHDGLLAQPYPGPASSTVNVSNSIFIADGADGTEIRAFGDGGGVPTVNVDHSNFGTQSASTGGTINDLGGNQTAAPLIDNLAALDFDQLAGSPTINAGATVADLGSLDWEREPRCAGTLPDIGADELDGTLPCPVPAGPGGTATTTPTPTPTSPTTGPSRKCKKAKKKKQQRAKRGCKKRKKKK